MAIRNLAIVQKTAIAKSRVGHYSPDTIIALDSVTNALEGKVKTTVNEAIKAIPGASEHLGSVTFGDIKNVVGRAAGMSGISGGQSIVGWAPDNIQLPDAYKVIITSKKGKAVIVAVLQDSIKFQATSEWQSFSDAFGISSTIAAGVELATKKSAVTTLGSRRIWRGTTPLRMTIPLRFEAVTDAVNEVVEPTLQLQRLALPSTGVDSEAMKDGIRIPLLEPPGPSPFKAGGFRADGEEITISIGKLWFFPTIIVKEVVVEYPTKYTEAGHPISAKVDMTFETYEMLTKEALSSAYAGK